MPCLTAVWWSIASCLAWDKARTAFVSVQVSFPTRSGTIPTNLDMEQNPYGEKIRKIRGLRGYSQEYMAEQLGLGSAKTYGRYETGESKLDVPHLEAIAKVFDMQLNELLSFDEKMFFNQCSQDHSQFGNGNQYHGINAALVVELKDRIKHLEEEILHLRKNEEFLQEQLNAALHQRT